VLASQKRTFVLGSECFCTSKASTSRRAECLGFRAHLAADGGSFSGARERLVGVVVERGEEGGGGIGAEGSRRALCDAYFAEGFHSVRLKEECVASAAVKHQTCMRCMRP
jgi:hypothetical protein